MNDSDIFKNMENDINSSNMDDNIKKKLFKNIINLKKPKINLMITGATGCGKSSTINAMFNMDKAKVGVGADPETMEIKKFELGNLILWDTPGLGDGKEKDIQHSKNIVSKLEELDRNRNPLIDLILVILDGGSRDLGTSYQLINSVIIPSLGKDAKGRILVAINQADLAMKGRHWDYEKNRPQSTLVDFLEEKVKSVKERVKEATDVDIDPIYYSAGFKEGEESQRPYNLSKLLHLIMKNTPTRKRLSDVNNTFNYKEMWEDEDRLLTINKLEKTLIEALTRLKSHDSHMKALQDAHNEALKRLKSHDAHFKTIIALEAVGVACAGDFSDNAKEKIGKFVKGVSYQSIPEDVKAKIQSIYDNPPTSEEAYLLAESSGVALDVYADLLKHCYAQEWNKIRIEVFRSSLKPAKTASTKNFKKAHRFKTTKFLKNTQFGGKQFN